MKITKYAEKFEQWRWKNWAAAGFSFVLVLAFLVLADVRNFNSDSGLYFRLANGFFHESSEWDAYGSFRLLAFPLTFRGMLFPLLLAPFNWLTQMLVNNTMYGWWLLVASMSALFSVSFPVLFKGLGRVHLLPLPIIITLAIWHGIFARPFADIVAVFLLVYALALLRTAYEKLGGGGG
ncbi:MAG: hypothetical protein FWG65_06410, partial [Turicibacter sp.]|nr:hypothetical protein [Turicibacter sp.]